MRKYINLFMRRGAGECIILLYCMFLLVMPDDLFRLTSVYTFTTPRSIAYKWSDFSVSILFLPVALWGLLAMLRRNSRLMWSLALFALAIVAKDAINIALGNNYIIRNHSYEAYCMYFASLAFVMVFLGAARDLEQMTLLWSCFVIITVLTLFLSMAMGITPGMYDYVNRYSSTNISHGETAFVLGITCAMLVKDRSRYKWLIVAVCGIGIIATGSRKDLIYVVLIYALSYLRSFMGHVRKKRMNYSHRISSNRVFIILGIVIAAVGIGAVMGKKIIDKLNLERVTDLISGLFQDSSKIGDDFSVQGRLSSLVSGIKLISKYPILGTNFSVYNQQFELQELGFPTFPHFSILYNWIIMGLLVFIIAFVLVRCFLVLWKHDAPMEYACMYYLIYKTVSGGALSSFKAGVLSIFLICMFVQSAKRAKKGSGMKLLIRISPGGARQG